VGQVFPKELMFIDVIYILSLCFIIMNSDPKLYFSTQIKDMHLIKKHTAYFSYQNKDKHLFIEK